MTLRPPHLKKACVDPYNCVACGSCVKVCPRTAIAIRQGLFAIVDSLRCIGCGACARECPAAAVTLAGMPS